MKIRNVNEKYGQQIEFEADDLPECIYEMANAIVKCGPDVSDGKTVDDLCWQLREGDDYEIIN